MSLADAFTVAAAHNKAIIERDTWGHLDTKPGEAHEGFILFALGCHGDITVLEWEFEGVESNPWIYREMGQFVAGEVAKKDRSWGVWFFEGTYRVLKNGEHRFSGSVRPCRVTTRFGKRRSF